MVFFFFKQKTAYEVRISDWSSDVCSSDLRSSRSEKLAAEAAPTRAEFFHPSSDRTGQVVDRDQHGQDHRADDAREHQRDRRHQRGEHAVQRLPGFLLEGVGGLRSEEHTSELQSLMRISYAVFCLKKKKHEPNL